MDPDHHCLHTCRASRKVAIPCIQEYHWPDRLANRVCRREVQTRVPTCSPRPHPHLRTRRAAADAGVENSRTGHPMAMGLRRHSGQIRQTNHSGFRGRPYPCHRPHTRPFGDCRAAKRSPCRFRYLASFQTSKDSSSADRDRKAYSPATGHIAGRSYGH